MSKITLNKKAQELKLHPFEVKKLQNLYWQTKQVLDIVLNADRKDEVAIGLRESMDTDQFQSFTTFIKDCEEKGIEKVERILS